MTEPLVVDFVVACGAAHTEWSPPRQLAYLWHLGQDPTTPTDHGCRCDGWPLDAALGNTRLEVGEGRRARQRVVVTLEHRDMHERHAVVAARLRRRYSLRSVTESLP